MAGESTGLISARNQDMAAASSNHGSNEELRLLHVVSPLIESVPLGALAGCQVLSRRRDCQILLTPQVSFPIETPSEGLAPGLSMPFCCTPGLSPLQL